MSYFTSTTLTADRFFSPQFLAIMSQVKLDTECRAMKLLVTVILISSLFIFSEAFAHSPYSLTLCKDPNYTCVKVKRGQSWEDLIDDESGREMIQKLNRINTELYPGMVIAIPHDLNDTDMLKVSPFPHQREPLGRTTITVDLSLQAFGAYDAMGTLVRWGPVSGGRGWCPDIQRGCHTPLGTYYIISKGGPECVSSIYPVGVGGAPMPFCMYFRGGFALHGSELPGYNASHGCVRLFYDDAEWLNHDFVELGKTKVVVTE
jgi:L,D-transpeptidase ErfK/SrfK